MDFWSSLPSGGVRVRVKKVSGLHPLILHLHDPYPSLPLTSQNAMQFAAAKGAEPRNWIGVQVHVSRDPFSRRPPGWQSVRLTFSR